MSLVNQGAMSSGFAFPSDAELDQVQQAVIMQTGDRRQVPVIGQGYGYLTVGDAISGKVL